MSAELLPPRQQVDAVKPGEILDTDLALKKRTFSPNEVLECQTQAHTRLSPAPSQGALWGSAAQHGWLCSSASPTEPSARRPSSSVAVAGNGQAWSRCSSASLRLYLLFFTAKCVYPISPSLTAPSRCLGGRSGGGRAFKFIVLMWTTGKTSSSSERSKWGS